jgi:hypothetical protein
MRDVTGLMLAGYVLLCHLDAGYYLDEAKLKSGLDRSINQILDRYLNPVRPLAVHVVDHGTEGSGMTGQK